MGDHVGEFFDLNGVPIPEKSNANDAIGVSAMGDSAGNKGDHGSKGDRNGTNSDRLQRNFTVVGSMRGRPLQNGISQSWAPKKGGITNSNDSGEISQVSIAAAQAISGVVHAIKGTSADPVAPFSEHERKGDLQGSGLAGKGYVHHYPDIPATTNLEMANGPLVKSWKSLVSMPVKSGSPLQFYRPHCVDGKFVAKPPAEAVNEGIDMWKGCLVGQFLDKRLPFPVVRSLVNRLWGKREMPDISTTENGLFFFRFGYECWTLAPSRETVHITCMEARYGHA